MGTGRGLKGLRWEEGVGGLIMPSGGRAPEGVAGETAQKTGIWKSLATIELELVTIRGAALYQRLAGLQTCIITSGQRWANAGGLEVYIRNQYNFL